MLRTRSDGSRVEVTSAPGLPRKAVTVLALAAALLGLGWLLFELTRSQTLHFTCDRPSGSCALQVGDEVALLRLGSIRAVTVVRRPLPPIGTEQTLIIVLDDGTNRVIGRDSLHPTTGEDYGRAAEAIRQFMAGDAETIRVGYTVRQALPESWRALLLGGGGLLLGGALLLGWSHRQTIVHDGTVTFVSSGPLRRHRERKVARAETTGVARVGGGRRQRLELELKTGKTLRLTAGVRRGKALDEAEAALRRGLAPEGHDIVPSP